MNLSSLHGNCWQNNWPYEFYPFNHQTILIILPFQILLYIPNTPEAMNYKKAGDLSLHWSVFCFHIYKGTDFWVPNCNNFILLEWYSINLGCILQQDLFSKGLICVKVWRNIYLMSNVFPFFSSSIKILARKFFYIYATYANSAV